jgi:hypothetical protein
MNNSMERIEVITEVVPGISHCLTGQVAADIVKDHSASKTMGTTWHIVTSQNTSIFKWYE